MSDLSVDYADDALVISRGRNRLLAIVLAVLLVLDLGLLSWSAWMLAIGASNLETIWFFLFATRIALFAAIAFPIIFGIRSAWYPVRVTLSSHGVSWQRSRSRSDYIEWKDVRDLIIEHTGLLPTRRNYRIRLEGDHIRMSATTEWWAWNVDELRDLAFTLGRRLRKHNPDARILDYEEWSV